MNSDGHQNLPPGPAQPSSSSASSPAALDVADSSSADLAPSSQSPASPAPLEYRGQSGPQAEANLLLDVYRVLLTARGVDERLWVLSRQGRVNFVLTARGHEVAQAASAAAMRIGVDSAWLYYRDMAVGLALGVTPYEVFLGGLARADDPHSGGRQLTMHLASPRLRIGTMSSAVAAHIPHAVGAAYAARVLGEDSVAMCYFGDGATAEGDTHESMNWAAVHRLPVVFLCENNGIAISTPLALQSPTATLADRAAAYGMPGLTLDGCDTLAVYRATWQAVQHARAGQGPTFLELRVPRITPHSSQDDDAYRADADRLAAASADPLPRLRQELLERALLTEAQDHELATSIREQVTSDALRAQEQSDPEPGRARRWLYAGDPPHPYQAELEFRSASPDRARG